MRENRMSGLEGGGAKPIVSPYPFMLSPRFAGYLVLLIISNRSETLLAIFRTTRSSPQADRRYAPSVRPP